MPAWFVQREELLREITLKHGERRFPCVRSCVQESQKVPHCLLQLIEDLPSKQPVVGSNPTGGVSNQLRGRSTSHTTSSKLVVLTAVKIQSA